MTAPAFNKNPAATRMLKFYDLGEALEIARSWLLEPDNQQQLLDADGDLDALPELKELLEGVEADFAIKAENVALMAREFDLTAKATKSEVERLWALQKAAESSATGLKAYLRIWFLRLNIKKVEGTRAKSRVQINNPAVKSTLKDLKSLGRVLELPPEHRDDCTVELDENGDPVRPARVAPTPPSLERRLFDVVREIAQGVVMEGV